MTPPNRKTTAGRVFLDLRRLAQSTGRPTDELLQLYALEGFLDRLTRSDHHENFVLKGGVLLAAYEARRATRDIDFAAREVSNDLDTMVQTVQTILTIPVDDGLAYDPESLRAQIIREDDDYSGVRITAIAQLATARLHFHLDINVGDPIWPEPTMVTLPRLLGTDPIQIIGYPVAMILAEKIVTAMQRGTANTRWRDFVDINALIASNPPDAHELRQAVQRVADHRAAIVRPLARTLDGYAAIAQPRWAAWRRNQRLESTTPADFADVLQTVIAYVDTLLTRTRNSPSSPNSTPTSNA